MNWKLLAETITAITTALAGLAGLIALAGVLLVREQLEDQALPYDIGTLSALPPSLTFATGVSYVAIPAVVLIAGGALIVALAGPLKGSGKRRKGLTAFAWIALASALPLLFLINSSVEDPSLISWLLAIPIAGAGIYLSFAVWDDVQPQAWSKLAEKRRLVSPVKVMGLATCLSFFVFVWAVYGAFHRAGFPSGLVCTTDGGRYEGFLIAETSDRTYVGESGKSVVAIVESDQLLDDNIATQVRLDAPEFAVSFTRDPRNQPLIRAEALVVHLDPLFSRGTDEKEQLLEIERSNLPIIGFYSGEQAKLEADKFFEATIPENDPEAPRQLTLIDLETLKHQLVSSLHGIPEADDEEPEENRISSIPNGNISRVVIGGSGNCVAQSSSSKR